MTETKFDERTNANTMHTIQLTLELPEVNQILGASGKLPFEDVFALVSKIQQQSQSQLQPQYNQGTPPAENIEKTEDTQ